MNCACHFPLTVIDWGKVFQRSTFIWIRYFQIGKTQNTPTVTLLIIHDKQFWNTKATVIFKWKTRSNWWKEYVMEECLWCPYLLNLWKIQLFAQIWILCYLVKPKFYMKEIPKVNMKLTKPMYVVLFYKSYLF